MTGKLGFEDFKKLWGDLKTCTVRNGTVMVLRVFNRADHFATKIGEIGAIERRRRQPQASGEYAS